jgi:glycosyltransferase involved in cell wall biosynthesis
MTIQELWRKIQFKLNGKVIHLKAKGPVQGNVLLSYITLPFISPQTINGHTNRWECKTMAEIFLDHGYNVDVIDFTNDTFQPRKKYDMIIDNERNLERLSAFLPDALKIFHITTAHWQFQNNAELLRIDDIQKRKGVHLMPRRQLQPSKNIETADVATMLGNDFTAGTYAFAQKPITRIHISTTHTYPLPENKDFVQARNRFIWLGGSGMAHKGLDLVLEAFAEMPQLELFIFGKKDPDFAEAYEKEFSLPNIHYKGNVDLGSVEFKNAANTSVSLIFPSSSEGSSGGVVTAMHAGLIPIISFESGVDVESFGIILKENTVAEIKKQVQLIAQSSPEELKSRAHAAWQYARNHHTREQFKKSTKILLKKF